MRCLDGGSALAMENHGMIDKTEMEQRAIRDARSFLAAILTELGLMAPFFDRPPAEIDRIIEACVDGFQDSMLRQSARGDVPF
jgi:membrane-bound lytic murein transglycosylase MltF